MTPVSEAVVENNLNSEAKSGSHPTTLTIFLLIMMMLVSIGCAGAVAYLIMDKDGVAKEDPREQATSYFRLEPSFVVNLGDAGMPRYMQADVEIVTSDASTLQAIQLHSPALRNRVLLLLGQQRTTNVGTRKEKEDLQAKALNEVKSVLTSVKAANKVDGVIFTNLVIQ